MDHLCTFTNKTPVSELLAPHVRGRMKAGRRVRALDFSGKDRQLLQVISDADFTVCGLSNAALRKKLASTAWGTGRTDKQISARISRHLRHVFIFLILLLFNCITLFFVMFVTNF